METYAEIDRKNLILTVPEGFTVLDDAGYRELGATSRPGSWAIRNKDAHLMCEVIWKKLFFFSSKVTLETSIRATEQNFAAKIPTFQKIGTTQSRTIGGEAAIGFRYTYTVSGIDMTADYYLLKRNKQYYAFHWIGQSAVFQDNLPIFDALLESVRFL